MKYKCPHCKTTILPEQSNKAFLNADSYGSDFFTLQCLKCKGKVRLYLCREVKLETIFAATDHADLSFG